MLYFCNFYLKVDYIFVEKSILHSCILEKSNIDEQERVDRTGATGDVL
jgi:hypothetical protein